MSEPMRIIGSEKQKKTINSHLDNYFWCINILRRISIQLSKFLCLKLIMGEKKESLSNSFMRIVPIGRIVVHSSSIFQ